MAKQDTAAYDTHQTIYGLRGAGGCAREVMPFMAAHIARINQPKTRDFQKIYFVNRQTQNQILNGHPVISEDAFLELKCHHRFFTTVS